MIRTLHRGMQKTLSVKSKENGKMVRVTALFTHLISNNSNKDLDST